MISFYILHESEVFNKWRHCWLTKEQNKLFKMIVNALWNCKERFPAKLWKKLDLLAVRIIAKVKALKLSSSESTTQGVDNSSWDHSAANGHKACAIPLHTSLLLHSGTGLNTQDGKLFYFATDWAGHFWFTCVLIPNSWVSVGRGCSFLATQTQYSLK